MGEIKFVDDTIRDGNQSLWGATGLTTGMILPIAPALDNVGFKAINLTASSHMGVLVRYHKENPWEMIRLVAKEVRKTPLSFTTTGRRFIGFKLIPDSVRSLVLERVVANGIRRIWLLDASHEVDEIKKSARMAKAAGAEEVVVVFCFTISPVHTDEYYVKRAREIGRCSDADALCLEDQGGLLTIDRVRTLLPGLKEAIGNKPLEAHFHCNTGFATACYLEAIRLGVEVIHATVPPLAEDTSLPSVQNIRQNLPYVGYGAGLGEDALVVLPSWVGAKDSYWANIDEQALEAVTAHFQSIAEKEGRPLGQPVQHDAYYYIHQIPGGMMTTLKRQLSEIKKRDRLPQVLEEVVRVRQELGYPVMATPFSQLVGSQATMNVIYGERYKVVPVGIVQYAAGWFGPSPAPIDPAVFDKIVNQPTAKEIFATELPQPTVQELRREMGLGSGVSDEEFLLRYVMTNKEVDAMHAAGPVKTSYP